MQMKIDLNMYDGKLGTKVLPQCRSEGIPSLSWLLKKAPTIVNDLVNKLLVLSPLKRLTATELYQQTFFAR